MSFAMNYTQLVAMMPDYAVNNSDAYAARLDTLILFAQKRIARELKILGMINYVIGAFQASEGVISKPSRWLDTVSMRFGTGSGQVNGASVTNAGNGKMFYPPTITSSAAVGSGATFVGYVNNGFLVQVVPTAPGSGYTLGAPVLTVTPAAPDVTAGATGAAAAATLYSGNNANTILHPRSYEWCRLYAPDPTVVGLPKFYADYDFFHWPVAQTPSTAWPIEIAYHQLAQPIDAQNQTNWLTDNAPDLLLYACMLESGPYLKGGELQTWQAMYAQASAAYQEEDENRVAGRETVRVVRNTPNASARGAP